MSENLSPSAMRVQEALTAAGFALVVRELPASTRTAAEAAAAIGCEVAQIAKSLVFRGAETNEPVLVVASGVNRVNEALVGKLIGEKIAKADAAYVRETTGFAIGGIPPVGHVRPVRTIMDEDLFNYPVIWAAAGTPHAVFELTPEALRALTAPVVAKVS